MNSNEQTVFRKAIVAAAFSPRLHAVLNEAYVFLKSLGVWPVIVHVDEETHAVRTRLEEEIDRTSFREHPPVCIVKSGSPVDVLCETALEQQADLIVAGALQREHGFKYYLGSVARTLARHAPCSVLLFAHPQVRPRPIRRIHCAIECAEEDEYTVRVAAGIAFWTKAKDLYYTRSFKRPEFLDKSFSENPDEIKSIYHEEETILREFLQGQETLDIEYTTRVLYEKSKAVTISFTKEIGADLLIVSGPKNRLGLWERLFPNEMELALQDLPCSLLITKKPDKGVI